MKTNLLETGILKPYNLHYGHLTGVMTGQVLFIQTVAMLQKTRVTYDLYSLTKLPVEQPVYTYLCPVVNSGEKWHRINVCNNEWPL